MDSLITPTESLSLRRGLSADEDWLFNLFRSTMQNYIDTAWGWDELLQHEGFTTSLPAKNFQVLDCNSERVGSYHLTDKGDFLLLDMILVEPQMQRRGFGRFMMRQIQECSQAGQKPIELSVLKTNPAIAFHCAVGFTQIEEDKHSVKMRWR